MASRVVAGQRAAPREPHRPGGRPPEAPLPPGGHISRGAGHPGDADVSGRDEPAEDMRRHPVDVPENLGSPVDRSGRARVRGV